MQQRREPGFLVSLRMKTGLTQSVIAMNVGCARTTVVRWEETGKIQDKHYAVLAQLANDVAGPGTVGLKPLGRPQRTWKLRGQRNARDAALLDLRFYLWKPGDINHLWELWAPPVGVGDNWLEEHKNDPDRSARVWFRWERGANMSERIVSVLSGKDRKSAAEHEWKPEHMNRNPRLFSNYERPQSMAELVRQTAEAKGYSMPEG